MPLGYCCLPRQAVCHVPTVWRVVFINMTHEEYMLLGDDERKRCINALMNRIHDWDRVLPLLAFGLSDRVPQIRVRAFRATLAIVYDLNDAEVLFLSGSTNREDVSLAAHIALASHYSSSPELRQLPNRVDHIRWIITHHPECEAAGYWGTWRIDTDQTERKEELLQVWRQHLASNPSDEAIVMNAQKWGVVKSD